jgi:phosphate transport system substrate-binding protein
MGMMLIHSAAVETDFSLAQYSRMLRELRDAERLSISFRFETGATELDEESKGQLARLGARMEAGEFAGLELLIVGFADSSGPSALNTEIADGRARAVRDILVDAVSSDVTSRLRLRPVSYGELLPLACNDDEAGRSNNRRVEIWVRRLGARTN